MLFSQNRQQLRSMYADAWQKARAGKPLSPLEAQIAAVVEQHPEYHAAVADVDADRDYPPEAGQTNPFLHMGLHLSLREQVATDRPAGIAAIHAALMARDTAGNGDPHAVEHRMIDCLAETLWQAQRDGEPPDERRYLERLRRL